MVYFQSNKLKNFFRFFCINKQPKKEENKSIKKALLDKYTINEPDEVNTKMMERDKVKVTSFAVTRGLDREYQMKKNFSTDVYKKRNHLDNESIKNDSLYNIKNEKSLVFSENIDSETEKKNLTNARRKSILISKKINRRALSRGPSYENNEAYKETAGRLEKSDFLPNQPIQKISKSDSVNEVYATNQDITSQISEQTLDPSQDKNGRSIFQKRGSSHTYNQKDKSPTHNKTSTLQDLKFAQSHTNSETVKDELINQSSHSSNKYLFKKILKQLNSY